MVAQAFRKIEETIIVADCGLGFTDDSSGKTGKCTENLAATKTGLIFRSNGKTGKNNSFHFTSPMSRLKFLSGPQTFGF